MNKKKVRITNTGYLPNSPDRHNPMNIIPSNRITMDRVPFPIMGIDNLGNHQMMMPGMNYRFPGQYVTEIPMGSYNPRKRYNDLRQKQNNLEQLRDNYLRKNIQNYDPTNFVKYNTPYEGTGLSLNESNELERLSTLGYLTPEEKSRSFDFKQGGKIAKYQGDKEPSQVGTSEKKPRDRYHDIQLSSRAITCPEGYIANEKGKCELKYPYVTIQQFEHDFDLSKATDAEKDIYNRYNTAEKYWSDKGYIPYLTEQTYGVLGDYDTFAPPSAELLASGFNEYDWENVIMNPDSPNSLLAPSFGGIHYFGNWPDESIPKIRVDKNIPLPRQTMYVHPDIIDPKTGVVRGSYEPGDIIGKDKPGYCPGCIREANQIDPKEGYYITNDENSTDLGVGYLHHWYTDPSGKHITERKGSVLHRDYMSPDEFTNWRSNPSNDRYDVLFDPSKTIYKNSGDAYKVLQTERTNKYQSQAEARRKADYEKIQSLKKKKQGGIYLGNYEFKNGGLVKMQGDDSPSQVSPKGKGWREYKTPTGQSLYLDPRFNNQRYYVDEKGNAITPDQNMSLFDVQDNIWESGTSMAPLEVSPRYTYRQVPGALGAMETIRVDADNGTEQIVSPDVMKTNREGQSFINTMSPFGGGLLVEGVGNIAQGNIGQGLIETALSIPIVGQTIGKVVTAPLKFAGREVASTYGPLLSHTGEYLGNQFDRGLTFLEKNQGVFGISPKVKNIPSSKTLTSAEMSRLAEMDRGMAIQSEPLNRYQKVQKIINHINSSNNLSDADIKTMFGSTREELFKELEAGAKTLGPPPGAVPREASNINLSRPARNRTSEQIAADNARRARRSTNSAVQNLNQTLANNNYNIDDAQALLESIPAYERQGLNLTTDTEGLPVIELDVSNVVDRDVIANLADKVVKPTRIKRTKDAIKDLFSSNPVYKGDVKKLTPDLHAYTFKSPRHMLLDVKSKLDKGLKDLNIGEVATGSTDTSHNSYLNQMDFIAQNAGKEGLSQPIFLGYQPMNPAGYLSNAQVPQEEIFKYINTKLNELQRRRNFNFNLGENPPFMEGDKIMIPQYGVKKVSDSFKGIKKQEGGSKEMPFGLPLKEQNVYLLPEYNQPINPFTGEILPDMRRPNLGMGTGATEYKYTYGTDKGDIDIPSIVAGQYIGDQALNRYNLTGERFKTMNDPGSYSKFYDEMNKLGLMQERNGGAIKKVKIKSLPRKNK